MTVAFDASTQALSLCGWDPGGTPKELLAQLYLSLFTVLVLMRDAIEETFGPLFYPICLVSFFACAMPSINLSPAGVGSLLRHHSWEHDATFTTATLADLTRNPPLETAAAAAPAPGGTPRSNSWDLEQEPRAAGA